MSPHKIGKDGASNTIVIIVMKNNEIILEAILQ